MARLLKVQATRSFQAHRAGDVLLVEDTDEVRKLVAAKLFDVIAIEEVPEHEGVTPKIVNKKAKSKTKAKASV